ncbi:hypothetical protein [Aeromonas veronii]|uniref:hypothetical protein n=1 Tax=Aeromonas veronii TaxID=654 RepID=UPI001E3D90C1|nr:hypothetical protein [Aeromonas veronii]MCD6619955.1 hypothetical protein [Aeromonas veronii]
MNKTYKNISLLLVMSGVYFLITYVLKNQFFGMVEAEKEINTGFMSLKQYLNSINGLIDGASNFSIFSFIGFWLSSGMVIKLFKTNTSNITPSIARKLIKWGGIAFILFGHFIWNAAANFNLGYMWKDGLPKEPISVDTYLAEVNYVVDSMQMVVGAASYSYIVCLGVIVILSRIR